MELQVFIFIPGRCSVVKYSRRFKSALQRRPNTHSHTHRVFAVGQSELVKHHLTSDKTPYQRRIE